MRAVRPEIVIMMAGLMAELGGDGKGEDVDERTKAGNVMSWKHESVPDR